MMDERDIAAMARGDVLESEANVQRPHRVPEVRAASRGKVGFRLDSIAAQYERANPKQKCRWVLDPRSNPDLSQVVYREAQQYRLVLGKELPVSYRGIGPDDPVRVADLVLMSIDADIRAEIEADLAQMSQDRVDQIEKGYYDAIAAEADPNLRPRGRSIIEERDFDIEITQR